MKKLLLISFAFILLSLMVKVTAAPVISITETSYTNDRISIKGTGTGEIQIVLFGLDNAPLFMTTATAENGIFAITLPPISGLNVGIYNIKVSDYEGVNIAAGTVEIKAEVNPLTVDNIMTYIVLGSISLMGIIVLATFIYKNSKKSKN